MPSSRRVELMFALGSCLLSVILFEGGARVLVREPLPHALLDEDGNSRVAWLDRHQSEYTGLHNFEQPDPVLGWRPRPNIAMRSTKPGSYDVIVTTNAFGLRGGTPATLEKPTGVVRIGIFGDSHTWGLGVRDEETYSARLASLRRGVEILNFGVGGFGTDQMLLYYEHEGRRYGLDVVVVTFEWYQLSRISSRFKFYAKPWFELTDGDDLELHGVPVPTPDDLLRTGITLPWYTRLGDHSRLLRWAWSRVLNTRDRTLFRAEGAAWRLAKALLARFAQDARDAGARMVLLHLPDEGSQGDQLNESLAALAQALSVPYLDTQSTLYAMNREGHAYRLPNDGHLGPAGHAAVAATLDAFLTEHALGLPLRTSADTDHP